jgi:hypothetical protein
MQELRVSFDGMGGGLGSPGASPMHNSGSSFGGASTNSQSGATPLTSHLSGGSSWGPHMLPQYNSGSNTSGGLHGGGGLHKSGGGLSRFYSQDLATIVASSIGSGASEKSGPLKQGAELTGSWEVAPDALVC